MLRYRIILIFLAVLVIGVITIGCTSGRLPNAEHVGNRVTTTNPDDGIRPERPGDIGPDLIYGVKDLPAEMPDDVHFVLKYGVGSWSNGLGPRNMLDTFKGVFAKDMITSDTVTTKLTLSHEELRRLYKEMARIKIFSYPSTFTPKSNMMRTPSEAYYFKIQADGRLKEIYWDDANVSQSHEAVELRNLIRKIRAIIEKKEEYRRLPEPKGGYG